MNVRPGYLAAACGCLLALAGCTSDKKDEWDGRGRPIPVPNEPSPSQPADMFVTGLGGLEQALEGRVMAAGGLVRPIATRCDTVDIAPSFTCRITYMGQVITYTVTTRQTTSTNYNWRATPDVLVTTKAGIEAALWRKYSSQATAIRCDASLPTQQRVRPGTKLKQRCYFKPTFKNQYFGDDTDNAGRTVAVGIVIPDGPIELVPRTQ
ncbi:hypothetical protein GCM10023191_019290 [Actinoallomurus oryzae]|uniref:DUF4333 domain-containing protein n=1 Tax=Actinoallomurus oryzae TaxID=502180 RepID=A0ABP8PMM5_9ACTN